MPRSHIVAWQSPRHRIVIADHQRSCWDLMLTGCRCTQDCWTTSRQQCQRFMRTFAVEGHLNCQHNPVYHQHTGELDSDYGSDRPF